MKEPFTNDKHDHELTDRECNDVDDETDQGQPAEVFNELLVNVSRLWLATTQLQKNIKVFSSLIHYDRPTNWSAVHVTVECSLR